MDEYFQEHAFSMRPISPGAEQFGFVYTNLSEGNKVVLVRLLGAEGSEDFEFSLPVKGLDVDHLRRDFDGFDSDGEATEMDIPQLRQYLESAPATTMNARDKRAGDPVNLVIVGDFVRVLGAFGARWDETEVISLAACWKTFRAFLTGAEYPILSGQRVVSVRSQPGLRPSADSQFHQRTTSPAVVGHFDPVPRPMRLGRDRSVATSASGSPGGPGI